MDNERFRRIATRIAASTVQLQGPFNLGAPAPKYTVEVELPFGLSGEILNLLMKEWGEDPKNLNAAKEFEKGPIPDVSVGYSVSKSDFHKGQVKPNWYSPGDDDEFDFEIQITHLGGIGLSNVDVNTLDKAGLTKIVHDAVVDKHALEAAQGQKDDNSD